MPVPMPVQPKSPPPEVIHHLTVGRIVDGDTISGTLVVYDSGHTAFGFTVQQSMTYNGRVRLLSVNAPEKATPEGQAALAFVQSVIKPGDVIETRAPRDLTDQYGRVVADLWYVPFNPDQTQPQEPVNLSAVLLAQDMAEPMDGKKLTKLAPQLRDEEAEHFVAHVPALVKANRS